MRHRLALVLFRRDLRLDDNTALVAAAERAERVLPAFVFEPPQQAGASDGSSPHALQFLVESLADLDGELAARGGRLYRFAGEPAEVVGRLIAEAGVDAVFLNRGYHPAARRAEEAIERTAAAGGAAFARCGDALLHEPGEVLTLEGTPYAVFTPFHRRAAALPVRAPRPLPPVRWLTGSLPFAHDAALDRQLLPVPTAQLHVRGGRTAGLARLAAARRLDHDAAGRDLPAVAGTSSLSADLAHGTLSAREVHHALAAALGRGHELLRQLHWRDFFTHLAWHHPRVFAEPFDRRMAGLAWEDHPERLAAWQAGRTGFPLVDAGMRQLAATGWMHNRVRMVAASFLAKDLHLDWRLGERWFARRLVDFDPCVNDGNWQWAAGTGADARPLRIFNPWRQQERFDPQCAYVRRWLPELAALPTAAIHRLAEERPPGLDYPPPIVDHRRERRRSELRYRAALGPRR
ncbi:MAG TPA: deoxyribodipyrimidine photo-lyase [Thermoanaerobaculia bacterium]